GPRVGPARIRRAMHRCAHERASDQAVTVRRVVGRAGDLLPSGAAAEPPAPCLSGEPGGVNAGGVNAGRRQRPWSWLICWAALRKASGTGTSFRVKVAGTASAHAVLVALI